MPTKLFVVLCLLLSSACATQPVTKLPAPTVPSAPIVPVADYHAHISSKSISELTIPPMLPAIQLPEDLARLIRDRELEAEPEAVSKIYTEDVLLLDNRFPMWVRGRKKVETWLGLTVRGLKFVPIEAQTNGATGFIAGTVTRNEKHIRSFHFSIRNENGVWRIASEIWSSGAPPLQQAYPAEPYIAELDAAKIRRGVVLSSAFVFADRAKLAAENDWIAQQVALHPDRLVGFCGVNPLHSYAIEEARRCAKELGLKGMKMHFADAGVDLRKPEHVQQLRDLFRAANDAGLAITAHVSTNDTRKDVATGRESATIFLNELLPAAPDVTVQIAHMTSDTGWDPTADAAFEVFANAIAAGDPRTRNLYFDASGAVTPTLNDETMQLLVRRMRQAGLQRILFGSDRSGSRNPPPADAWKTFRRLPLTDEELRIVAGNVMPYLR